MFIKGLNRQFEPWLARGLHILGVHVIGVDSAVEGEPFRHYQRNLLKSDSLADIADESVDLANANALFSSPSVGSRGKLWDAVAPQLDRILKPEAMFIYQDHGSNFRI